MRLRIYAVLLTCGMTTLLPQVTHAQTQAAVVEDTTLTSFSSDQEVERTTVDPPEYFVARVIEAIDDDPIILDGITQPAQLIKLEYTDAGKTISTVIEYGGRIFLTERQLVRKGQRVVISRQYFGNDEVITIHDRYRLPQLWLIAVFFFACAVVFGRWRGASATIGLFFTILVLILVTLPLIIRGYPPVAVALGASGIIAGLGIYLAHGFSRRSSMALVAIIITLLLAVGLAYVFVWLTRLTGLGTEEAYGAVFFVGGPLAHIDYRGILLAGMIIGALGVLDDIATAQVAVVEQLKLAAPQLGGRELYRRSLVIGREHIASLVNTLVLAYVGASFPFLLVVIANPYLPTWVMANSEMLTEEIVRTVVGSIALIFAVPIASGLAAWWYAHHQPNQKTRSTHTHQH